MPGAPLIKEQIMMAVRRAPGLPAAILARRLGVSEKSIDRPLQQLMDLGVLMKQRILDRDHDYYNRDIYFLPEELI